MGRHGACAGEFGADAVLDVFGSALIEGVVRCVMVLW